MKQIIIAVCMLLFAVSGFAQQRANFQGKVFVNNVAVTKTDTIQFFIGPPLSWSSPLTKIDIINGLYSTVIEFPDNLFDSAHTSREMIVILDGTAIDTVTIFPALERDPTVRSYIRDSIKWADVHGKPTVDTSHNNELQTLSLQKDTLHISGGNYVLLPDMSTVNGSFKVIDTSIRQVISTLGSGYSPCGGTAPNIGYWQSFKAPENGKLRQLVVSASISCGSNVLVYIYDGVGNTSQALGQKICPAGSTFTTQAFDLSSGWSSSVKGYITLIAGRTYTFEIIPQQVGCTLSVGCNSNNPYQDGLSSIGSSTDIAFALSLDKSDPPNLSIIDNGYTGIGIDSPTSQLHVGGRIKDATGFIMPVGAIISYGGSTAPEGWLLCDGRAVSRIVFADLFAATGTAHGIGNGTTTFNLPDMRGKFLRGVDNSPNVGSSNTDPDRNTRSSTAGGNSGNTIGSVQTDAFRSHVHDTPYPYMMWQGASTGPKTGTTTSNWQTASSTNAAGGSETRPVNVYVNYIIKY